MNGIMLNLMLSRYAKNVPSPEEVDKLWQEHEGQLRTISPEKLDELKPKYPTLAPAIEQIKKRIAGVLIQ